MATLRKEHQLNYTLMTKLNTLQGATTILQLLLEKRVY